MEKMTKKDYFNVLKDVVLGANVENEVELIEFLDRQIELVSKKSNTKTKVQKENEGIMELVYDALRGLDNAVTVTDLQKVEGMNEYSNQKLSALLKKLVAEGRVEKTIEGKKSVFKAIV